MNLSPEQLSLPLWVQASPSVTFEAVESAALTILPGWEPLLGDSLLLSFARRVFDLTDTWADTDSFLAVLEAAAAITAHAGCSGFNSGPLSALLAQRELDYATPETERELLAIGFITPSAPGEWLGNSVPEWATDVFYGPEYILAVGSAA